MLGELTGPGGFAESCVAQQCWDPVVPVALERMTPSGEAGQPAQVVAVAAEVHEVQGGFRAQDAQDLAQRRDADVRVEVVEHQRGEHAVEAAVGVWELISEPAIELERESGTARFAACAGERFGVRVQSDDLELRVRDRPRRGRTA